MRQTFKLNAVTCAIVAASTGMLATPPAVAGPGFVDLTTGTGATQRLQTYFANSPSGIRQTAVPEAAALSSGQNTGTALRKFVDPLPLLGAANARFLNGDTAQANPKYIPKAVLGKWTRPDGTASLDDYLELAVVEYSEKFHSDLKKPTTLRGYVQIDQEASNGRTPLLGSLAVAVKYPNGDPILIAGTDPAGKLTGFKVPALAVDAPHYLGPVISATKGVALRLKFHNLLPAGRAEIASPAVVDPVTGLTISPAVVTARNGDLFLPFDKSILGAGVGPDSQTEYTQNRANVHLHGGDAPWISDGTPHHWITPVDEADPFNPKSLASLFANDPNRDPTLLPSFLRGASAVNVPDMVDPGAGAATYYYPNAQTARMLWVHDQTLGQTRLNAYAGMAAPYIVTDATEQKLVTDGVLPPADRTIPLVLQDRSFVPDDIALQDGKWNTSAWGQPGDAWFPHVYEPFETNAAGNNLNPVGRWYYGPLFWPIFPALYLPPTGEYGDASYVPEAYFDTPVVNGVAYPTLDVDPTTYRFRILNASVDRFMTFSLFEGKTSATLADGSIVTSPLGDTEVDMIPSSVPAITDICPTDPATGAPALRPTPIGTSGRYCVPSNWPADSRVGGMPDPKGVGPTLYQVANEGGWLPSVAALEPQPLFYQVDKGRITIFNPVTDGLFLAPAERADVVVDFSQFAGRTLIVYNDSGAPEPGADPRNAYFTGVGDQSSSGGAENTLPGYGPNVRTMMQIKVRPLAGNVAPAAIDPVALNAGVSAAYLADQERPIVAQPAYAGFDASWSTLSPTLSYASIYSATLKEPVFKYVPGNPSSAFNSIKVTSGGSGYVTAPVVDIQPSNGVGSGATARATLKMDKITVTNPGSGYTSAPTVVITALAGGGGGAVTETRLAPNNVTVTNGGAGYLLPPLVSFPAAPAGGTKPQAHAVVTNGVVTSVVVDVPGSGYLQVPNVTFTSAPGGGGSGARGTVTAGIDPLLPLKSPYPITPEAAGGGGYTDFNQVTFTFTGGSGTGAAATATGRVYDISITNNGSGYTAPPNVTVGAPLAGLTATAQVDRANGGASAGSALVQSKAIQELFDPAYARYNSTLGIELPFTSAFNQTTIPLGYLDEPTELLASGETQLWKFTHNGLFTQPIHFRGYSVQLLNRVGWDGFIAPPQPNEVGWKDTVRVNPLEDAIVALRPKKAGLPGFGVPNSIRPMDPTQPLGSPFGFTQIDPLTGVPKSVVNDLVNYRWEYSLQNGMASRSESDFTRAVVFDANEAVPSAPTLDAALLQAGAAVLEFTDKSSTEYKFSVRRADVDIATGNKTSAFVEVGTQLANGASFSDQSVVTDAGYAYKVAAVGANGESESNELFLITATTPPLAPSAFTATALSDKQVALSWTDNATNEVGYLLERSLDGGANWTALGVVRSIPTTTQVYSLPANSKAYPDAGYVANTHIDYRLSAVNSIGNSPSVTAAADTLAAPALTSLFATVLSDSAVTLDWTLPAALKPNQSVTAFNITRSGGAGPASFTAAGNATSFADTGLLQNTAYTYTVSAVNGSGASPVVGTPSTATVTTQFALPSMVTASAMANAATQVTLSWLGGAPAQTYTITRSDALGGTVNFTSSGSPLVDNTVVASTAYTYTVTAVNGNKTSNTATALVTTPAQINAPTLSSATVNGNRVQLTFTDNSTQETLFSIQRSTNGSAFVQIGTVNGNRGATGNVLNFSNSTTAPAAFPIVAGNVYVYQVVAQVTARVNGVTTVTAQSLPSAGITVVYLAPAAPMAGAVTQVRRNAGQPTDRVTLSWVAPVLQAGQPPVTGYTIEWSTTAAFTTVAGTLATGSTNVTANVTVNRGNRVAPNPAAYFFRIRATNVVGTGTPSTLVGPANTL